MSITITPQSEIKLCKTKLENDYKNTLNFSTIQKQKEYFDGLNGIIVGENDYTYIRANGTINVDIPYDQIIGYNYLYYTNKGFTNKRYYCFITGIRYVNENMTEISIETDVLQTWQFDLQFNKCYVEREHVSDDTIGLHTIPEQVETGEYIINATDYMMYDTNYYAVITASTVYNTPFLKATNTDYNGIFSGEFVFTFATTTQARNFLNIYDRCGQGAAINGVYMIPGTLYNKLDKTSDTKSYTDGSGTIECTYLIVNGTAGTIIESQKAISMQTTLNGYTPHNNKLKCYPYNYLELDNNNGASVIYHYEKFVNNSPSFQTAGAITPGCSVMCYPLNYNLKSDDHILTDGLLYSYNDGIPAGKYPIGSWKTDVYTNWLTQTGVNRRIGQVSSSIHSIGSAMSGNFEAAGSGLRDIFNSITEVYTHSLTPDQTNGNTNSGDVTYSMKQTAFVFKKKSIKQEYARVIDSFFDLYGYKVNSLKVPQYTSRRYWNYVKTIDCNCDGDIPQEDLNIIRSCFNNGITFWHDPSKMYDYSQTNSIV